MPIGVNHLEKLREMKEFATSLGVKMAVIQVILGESNQEAWNRHLKENPDDSSAMLKIFHQQQLQRAATGNPS
jgi:hypothetical protein